jgi:uncharacterized protein (DUF885 family)
VTNATDDIAGAAVAALADDLLEIRFDADPVYASLMGFRDRDERLGDHTRAGEGRLHDRVRDVVARAELVDPSALVGEDRVTRAVVLQQARAMLAQLEVGAIEYTVHPFVAEVPGLLAALPRIGIAEPAHAEGYLARLAGLPRALAAIADRHREGIAAGRLAIGRLTEATIAHLDRYLADSEGDPLRWPAPPPDSTVDEPAFRSARDELVDTAVRPAVARYRDMLAAEVLPHARPPERAGLCWLPGGDQLHARLASMHTTTDRTPEQLHRTGIELVAALTAECAEIGGKLFGTRDPAGIFARLREDPALRFSDGEQMLTEAAAAVERAEAAAPGWFGRLPRQPCTVEAVPPHEETGAPMAYYLPPALDGSRCGVYLVNTHQPTDRPRYLAEDVAFHEAIPGHHLQMALAQELTDLPLLRRLASIVAFEEGWGLYAERLADQMGLYSDPLSRLGMLTADSLRAARLVVDTGLHSLGWTRQRAVDYLHDHTTLPAAEIDSQVDLYLAAPGQALAYMVGRLEIERIRAAAERRLGDRFDIRTFHDTVLGYGSLPLAVLDQVVHDALTGSRHDGTYDGRYR